MAQIKTAISLDKSLHEQIDILAHKMKVSRSRLFAMALEDFLRHHENEQLLQEINRAYQDEPDQAQQTLRQGMRRLHRKIVEGEW
jgi:metal-responsive CopG/Arc/MetJ family transcriptional regulator